ncbi:3-oxo-5-alpha-steroid 4-dehydrogenase-domain-containing protein [Fennellomyces sp. T-0311]|nr:3-oxo-5-alpha-steroid 4-dehydrogenase-domain-containing protein [Fennellomyces sp. T-0311]
MATVIWPGFYVPEWTTLTIGCIVYGLSLVATALITERSTPMAYSKFGSIMGVSKLPSRIGMYIIYVPSVIVAILLRGWSDEPRFAIIDALVFVHFTKRVLEVAFVHVYSGNTDLKTSVTIAATYATTSGLNLALVRRTPASVFNDQLLAVGLACFVIGEVVNGYHHILLRRLRTSDDNSIRKVYVLPRGGLFDYCVTPHYAAEQLSYLGVIIASQNIVSFIVNGFPLVYLTIRSNSTYEWYKTRLAEEELPELKQRKRLLPGIW